MKQISVLILACICMLACRQQTNQQAPTDANHYDLTQMKDSGVLVALTLNSSISYFNYRGEPMGFQYELANQFAQSLGLKLEMKIARNTRELVDMLLRGEGDLIAYPLPVTKEFKDSVNFCGEDIITHQVLVQRTPQKKKNLLTNVTQLIGKEVYAKPGKYANRLNNLNTELGGGILIHEVTNDSITTEDLLTQVAQGTIDYAVCDNDLARLNKTYYPNLNVQMAISFDQRASWAVRKTSPLLAEAAEVWHQNNATSPAYKASTKKYFEQSKRLPSGPILSIKDGKVIIDTDRGIFDGVDRKDYGKTVRTYMRAHFRGKRVSDTVFTKISEREYTASKYTQGMYSSEDGIYEAKMQASTELDKIVSAGKFIGHEDAKHPHNHNENGYDRFEVIFNLDGEDFRGEMLIAIELPSIAKTSG